MIAGAPSLRNCREGWSVAAAAVIELEKNKYTTSVVCVCVCVVVAVRDGLSMIRMDGMDG